MEASFVRDLMFRDVGIPVVIEPRILVLPEKIEPPPAPPTFPWPGRQDPVVCRLLRAWARKPWVDVTRLALADRLEEMGHDGPARAVRSFSDPSGRLKWDALPRRERQRKLREFRALLNAVFGDFGRDTTCDGADTPAAGGDPGGGG